jgi:hypothetical protein
MYRISPKRKDGANRVWWKIGAAKEKRSTSTITLAPKSQSAREDPPSAKVPIAQARRSRFAV